MKDNEYVEQIQQKAIARLGRKLTDKITTLLAEKINELIDAINQLSCNQKDDKIELDVSQLSTTQIPMAARHRHPAPKDSSEHKHFTSDDSRMKYDEIIVICDKCGCPQLTTRDYKHFTGEKCDCGGTFVIANENISTNPPSPPTKEERLMLSEEQLEPIPIEDRSRLSGNECGYSLKNGEYVCWHNAKIKEKELEMLWAAYFASS
jgi:hypothetical protein